MSALCLVWLYKCVKIFTKNHIKHGKKHQNVPTEHKKREILFHKFLCEYILFLPPPFVEWGEMKIPKYWVGGGNQGKLGGQRENMNFVGVMGFFHFSLLICRANEWDGNAVNAIVTLA